MNYGAFIQCSFKYLFLLIHPRQSDTNHPLERKKTPVATTYQGRNLTSFHNIFSKSCCSSQYEALNERESGSAIELPDTF
jgi:hypothetical protein